MLRPPVPSRDEVIVFELLQTPRGARDPLPVGTAIYTAGSVDVTAPENVAVAVEEELQRPFVDRVQADERPPGYRRSGRGAVDFLVPGMPEHFRARMRGLWLSYPDGSVVTARAVEYRPPPRRVAGRTAPEPVVTDPAVRVEALARNEQALGGPVVKPHPPAPGLRPDELVAPVGRTDCGWIS